MKPARILLLVVAIVAGGLAAYLATRGDAPQTQVVETETIEEPKDMVLVASQTIGVGQRLGPSFVEWQEWPQSALRPEYVTQSALPDAAEQLTGTITRFEIFPGEPIRESKLVRSDQGYLSAVLGSGMRAVSLPVTAESSAGGYVVPNDRVDVVQTIESAQGLVSRTILQNVRVLAIGLRLGERGVTAGNPDTENPQSQIFQNKTIAILEVDPVQAEAIIGADREGDLSLVLRSIVDFSEPVTLLSTDKNSQSIRMIRFGVESVVLPESGSDTGQLESSEAAAALVESSVSAPSTFVPRPITMPDPIAAGVGSPVEEPPVLK